MFLYKAKVEMPHFVTPQGRRIAYVLTPGKGPGVVFLGGFGSDMTGTKAMALQDWAHAQGRAFLRFDYSGHGASSGVFEEGSIGEWSQDAQEVIGALTKGPQVIVGSSMGGWIALLLARAMPDRIAGLVGIAAAPDFTQDLMWKGFSSQEKAQLLEQGWVAQPSAYSEKPQIITRKLIEDGARHCVLKDPLALSFPARFLHGISDEEVPVATALGMIAHLTGADLQLTLVKNADHRFSTPMCLGLIQAAITEVTGEAHA